MKLTERKLQIIVDLQPEIHKLSLSQGYWPNVDTHTTVPRQLMNIVCELVEFIDISEVYLANTLEIISKENEPCDKKVDLTNAEEEIADIAIRILDLAAARGIKLAPPFYVIEDSFKLCQRNHASPFSGKYLNTESLTFTVNTKLEIKRVLEIRNFEVQRSLMRIIRVASALNELYRRGKHEEIDLLSGRTREAESLNGLLILSAVLAEQFSVDLRRVVEIKHNYNVMRTDIKSF